jgi:hypothetical protein
MRCELGIRVKVSVPQGFAALLSQGDAALGEGWGSRGASREYFVIGVALRVAIGQPGALRFFEQGGLLWLELLQRLLVNTVEFRVGPFPLIVHAVLHVLGGDRVFALRGGQRWKKEEKQKDKISHGRSSVRRESGLLARDGDSRLSQDVGNLCFAEAGGIVFKRDLIFLFVHVHAAQAIGVRKFAKPLQLLMAKRGMQVIGDFKKRHARDYTSEGPLPERYRRM